MPRPPKPKSVRQNRERRDIGEVSRPVAIRTPPPPAVLPKIKGYWNDFWASPLASVFNWQTDRPALERLFTLYDKRERNYRSAKKEPMVMGPMSQWIENPLGKTKDLDGEIRQLEDRFGLSPMARLKLGITFLDHQKSLQEMNADYNANVDPPPEDDPRAEIAPDAGAKSRQIH